MQAEETKLHKFNTLFVYTEDDSIILALQKYLPSRLKIIKEREFKFENLGVFQKPTARELLSKVPLSKKEHAVLVVYSGRMYSDRVAGYQVEGLAEKQFGRAIISTVTKPLAYRHTAVHETGHLLGLPHCSDGGCFMSDGMQARKYVFSWCKECTKKLN